MSVVRCSICSSHVPAEVAIEVAIGDRIERFCSLACAEAGEAQAAAGEPVAAPALPEPPRRILVAIDGSGPSLRATELALVLARLSKGSIALLHAVDPRLVRVPGSIAVENALSRRDTIEERERALRAEGEAQLRRCRRLCEAAGVSVTTRIALGPPARAIAEAAAEADLVVMGTRGLGALSGVALGSLTHRMISETNKPVLFVH